MAVYDGAGPDARVVRTLLQGDHRERGHHVEQWDRRDDAGRGPLSGRYYWRLLQNPRALKARYLLSIANDWPNGVTAAEEGLGSPRSVAVDATGVYVGAAYAENFPEVLKLAFDDTTVLWRGPGPRRLPPDCPGAGHFAMASMNERLYSLSMCGRITYHPTGPPPPSIPTFAVAATCLDAPPSTGLPFWGTSLEGATITPQSMDLAAWDARETSPTGGGPQLVVSYADTNEIVWFNPDAHGDVNAETCADGWAAGNVLRRQTIPHPLGVAIDNVGDVLVISGDQLLRVPGLRQTAGAPQPVVPGLVEPYRVDIVRHRPEPAECGAEMRGRGEIVIAERGTSQKVRRFCPGGHELRTLPADPASRAANGPFDPNAFRNILDIAADRDGGIYVVEGADRRPPPEEGPPGMRRVTHFDGDGRLLKQWFGGYDFGPYAEADPEHPSIVWITTRDGYFLRTRVNYGLPVGPPSVCRLLPWVPFCRPRRASWRLDATYFPPDWRYWIAKADEGRYVWRVLKNNGDTYLATQTWDRGFHLLKVGTDPATHRPALVECGGVSLGFGSVPVRWRGDSDGDGRLDPERPYSIEDYPPPGTAESFRIADDFTQTWYDGGGYSKLPVERWNAVGCPVYPRPEALRVSGQWRFPDAGRLPLDFPHGFDPVGLHWLDSRRDGVYVAATYPLTGARPAMCWPPSVSASTQCPTCTPLGLDVNGCGTGGSGPAWRCDPCRAWTLMRKHGDALTPPTWRIGDERTTGGENDVDCHYVPGHVMGTLYRMIGVTKIPHADYQAVIVTDRVGRSCEPPSPGAGGRAVVYAWSTDGLWIGDLFETREESGEIWKYALTGDNGAGSIYTDPRTGDVYYFGGSANQVKAYRITGWRKLFRASGALDL
jgi:hypothetical protein